MNNSTTGVVQSGSVTQCIGKSGLTTAALFGAFLLPVGLYQNQNAPLLQFSYTTEGSSSRSYETELRSLADEVNPLKSLVEYFLESDFAIPEEFASVPRDRFFAMYERF